MSSNINLDALVQREDFDVIPENTPSSLNATIQIRDLEAGSFFYASLKKPDFQRETSEWSADKITGFIESFLDGDLIPAIILWQAGATNFLIDGAHRLSALISWVHDDYGDGIISRQFFDGIIPEDQIDQACKARNQIKKRIGTYADHKLAIQSPDKFREVVLRRAKFLGSLSIQVQWVKGDSKKAEASFFKINQQAAPIDKTELRLLKARTLPNAMAARAILRSGTGHKYWSKFAPDIQSEIERLGKFINSSLFKPPLKTPIKTLDLPVAGKGYSAQSLPLIFDFINIVCEIVSDKELVKDEDGNQTLTYLKKCNAIVQRIVGDHPGALGLHPAVYFYSSTGRYQPTAFLACVGLLLYLDKHKKYSEFTRVRAQFEKLLLNNKVFVNQVTLKHGSGIKGYAQLRDLFIVLIDLLIQNKPHEEVLRSAMADPNFSFLQPGEVIVSHTRSDFDTDTKSAVFLRDSLKQALKCSICGGLIHSRSISIDHVLRKQDGGKGNAENGAVSHPYCNTTYKN
jgi:Protein of unknown function DUF262/HNH endonuclease